MLAKTLSAAEQSDEQALLEKMAKGDYKAFTTLYNTHVKQLTNYACKFTSDVQVIEDSVHDLFVWLWRNRQTLNINYSLKGYLFKSIRGLLLRKIQHEKKVILFYEADEGPFSLAHSSEEDYISGESQCLLQQKMVNVIALLTSKQQEVVYLRFYQDLSFDEIGANMNLTTKACYKLMGRAIAELRKTCEHEWINMTFTAFFVFIYFF